MKKLILGVLIGLSIGLISAVHSYPSYSLLLNEYSFTNLKKIYSTENNGSINSMTINTKEGVYRIFTIENDKGAGITAVKIN